MIRRALRFEGKDDVSSRDNTDLGERDLWSRIPSAKLVSTGRYSKQVRKDLDRRDLLSKSPPDSQDIVGLVGSQCPVRNGKQFYVDLDAGRRYQMSFPRPRKMDSVS